MQTIELGYDELCSLTHGDWAGPFAVSGRTFVYPDQPVKPGRIQLSFEKPPRHEPIKLGTTTTFPNIIPGNAGQSPILAPNTAVRLRKPAYEVWARILPGDGAIADESSGGVWQYAQQNTGLEAYARLPVFPDPTNLARYYESSRRLRTVVLYALDEGEDWQLGADSPAPDLVLPAVPSVPGSLTDRAARDSGALTASGTLNILMPQRFLTAYELGHYQSAVLHMSLRPSSIIKTSVQPATLYVPDAGYDDILDQRAFLLGNNFATSATSRLEWSAGSPLALAKKCNSGLTRSLTYLQNGTQPYTVRATWVLSRELVPAGIVDSSFHWAGATITSAAATEGFWLALPGDNRTQRAAFTWRLTGAIPGGACVALQPSAAGQTFPVASSTVNMSPNGGAAAASLVLGASSSQMVTQEWMATSRAAGAFIFAHTTGAGNYPYGMCMARAYRWA